MDSLEPVPSSEDALRKEVQVLRAKVRVMEEQWKEAEQRAVDSEINAERCRHQLLAFKAEAAAELELRSMGYEELLGRSLQDYSSEKPSRRRGQGGRRCSRAEKLELESTRKALAASAGREAALRRRIDRVSNKLATALHKQVVSVSSVSCQTNSTLQVCSVQCQTDDTKCLRRVSTSVGASTESEKQLYLRYKRAFDSTAERIESWASRVDSLHAVAQRVASPQKARSSHSAPATPLERKPLAKPFTKKASMLLQAAMELCETTVPKEL